MKLVLIFILSCSLILTSGCAKSNNILNTSEPGSNTNDLKPSRQDNSSSTKVDFTNNKFSNTDSETIDNPFFFKANVSQFNYKGNFLFTEVVKKDIKLHINEMAKLKLGKLYEIKIDSIEDIPNDRLNLGFFYIQKDKIIRIRPTEESLN